MTDPAQKEAEYFDELYETTEASGFERFHAANEPLHDRFIELLSKLSNGNQVLELGCGCDPFARMAADHGGIVTAIDVSATAVKKQSDQHKDIDSSRLKFVVMSAEKLDFPDNTFDLVFGSGILHHVELASTLREIERVLKPGGTILFSEPLGMNPVLSLYRKLTPKSHTPDEHPFKKADIELFERTFTATDIRYFSLFGPIFTLLPMFTHRWIFPVIWKLERLLLSLPLVRYWAWVALFTGNKK